MELRQLKYFVMSAEYLNFSEAAKHLVITQSTLSQQIKQLEYELGCSLFLRNSRHIILTEAGEEIGLVLQIRENYGRQSPVIYFTEQAEHFIIDNIEAVIAAERGTLDSYNGADQD